MPIVLRTRKLVRRLLLGPVEAPQQYSVGLREPQREVAAWLHGLGEPRDVTYRHLMACGAPFTIGIAISDDRPLARANSAQLSLQFRSRIKDPTLLGEILLRPSTWIDLDGGALQLFEITDSHNYCMPALRLWAHHLSYARQRARALRPDLPITGREVRAMTVFYSAPRPVVLVSVTDGKSSNMFPMNLLGRIGLNHYAFALNSTTPVRALVERAGSVALSSIPIARAEEAFRLGKNHRQESVGWKQLGFGVVPSKQFALPIPDFALRVREMRVEAAHRLGSHTMFVARTINVEERSGGEEFFMVHGIYQAWRERILRFQVSN